MLLRTPNRWISGLACGFALLTGSALGAEPTAPAQPLEFECRWAAEPISVDGRGDEPAWRGAMLIDRFSLPWLRKDARPAKTATKARLLWDRENLYFLAEMDDADVRAKVLKHDGPTWEDDVFELFFKPAADKPGYFEFEVNAVNTVFDLFVPQRGANMAGPYVAVDPFHVESKVVVHGSLNDSKDKDQGWTVEGRIPWGDFIKAGGRPEIDERWKFALCRYDYSTAEKEPELSTCAPLTQMSFHQHEKFATLRFVGPVNMAGKPFGIDKHVPLLISRVIGSPDPPTPYQVRRVYPKLNIIWPMAVKAEPGTRRLYYIAENNPYGPTTLHRTLGDPASGESEQLMRHDGVAYELAFHPNYKQNGYLYIGINESGPPGPRKTKVKRYTISRQPPFALDPKSERTIIEWPSDGHNGGALAFGLDGLLYVTSADGTSDSDRDVVGQDLSTLRAKVLRIDVEHPDAGREYSVPRDNPFVGTPGARPETWAYGLRNPWRITVDRQTGDVWVGNNGQDLWEQAYLVQRGANYGWSLFEGSHPFYTSRKQGPTPISPPTVEHHHSEARSLTGGLVYYGARRPELRGAYIYGDHSTGKVWGVRHKAGKVTWHKELVDTPFNITGFGIDADGELLIIDHASEGGFYTLEPTPADSARPSFPARLSDSGLFRSVRGHVMQPGVIPYSVNAQLWSDGAYKERYIAVPGKEPRISITSSGGWNFPDGAVLVKSFALELEEGKLESRRWIETRFLTRQQKEWVGYSYLWNDEQTDATLVAGGGLDRDYSIRVPRSAAHPDGVRKQTWHYPSRTECMVCHSRAANYVLGLSTLQMNRDHDYGPVRDNQLRTLEHLGLFQTDVANTAKDAVSREGAAQGLKGKELDKFVVERTQAVGQRAAAKSTQLALAPEKMPRLVDPYDKSADLSARARSYLHSNCAHCHVEAGGGNAQFKIEFGSLLSATKLVDVAPLHGLLDVKDARLIAPGAPQRSVLLTRVGQRGAGQMPPLATSLVDHEAVEMLREWIRQMKPE